MPQLLAMDEDGAETGVRCTLTSALTGQPDLSPADMQSWLGQLATMQAAIHAVPARPPTRWIGRYDGGAPQDWLADRGLRDAARWVPIADLGTLDTPAELPALVTDAAQWAKARWPIDAS